MWANFGRFFAETPVFWALEAGEMRWYLSRGGQTDGPFEDAQVAQMARAGQLYGAQIRDEMGSPWAPVERSPFASLQPKRSSVAGFVVALIVLSGGVYFLLGPLWAMGFAAFCTVAGVIAFAVRKN